jgi:hypothetical protein
VTTPPRARHWGAISLAELLEIGRVRRTGQRGRPRKSIGEIDARHPRLQREIAELLAKGPARGKLSKLQRQAKARGVASSEFYRIVARVRPRSQLLGNLALVRKFVTPDELAAWRDREFIAVLRLARIRSRR